MRPSLILTMLFCLSVGCKHFAGYDDCDSPCPNGKLIPCPPEKNVTCPTPEVQPCPPKEVRVSAPAPASAPVVQSAPAIQSAPVAMSAPQQVMMMAAPQTATGTTTQSVRPSRTRFALGFTTVHIPFPMLRFVPYTTPTEVTTTTEMTSAPVQQTAFIAQPTMAVQSAQVMAQPVAVQAAPQMVMVQQQAAPAPQPQVLAVPQPLAAPQACPPVSQQTLDQLQQELDRTKALLNKLKANPPPKASEKKSGDSEPPIDPGMSD